MSKLERLYLLKFWLKEKCWPLHTRLNLMYSDLIDVIEVDKHTKDRRKHHKKKYDNQVIQKQFYY